MKTATRQRLRRGIILVSFLLFPITMFYFSPVLIIQGAAAGIIVGSAVMFALQFASALFVGRAFCGWVCPAAGLQEACTIARDKRLPAGNRWIKYAIWVPWLSAIALAALAAGGFSSIDPLYQIDDGISISGAPQYVVYFGFIALIVGLALSAGRRAFCRYVCWMAPFMVVGRKLRNTLAWPSLRLLANESTCRRCGRCTSVCQQSLDVQRLVAEGSMEEAECILCGACVDACPSRSLRFDFSSGTTHPVRPKEACGDGRNAA